MFGNIQKTNKYSMAYLGGISMRRTNVNNNHIMLIMTITLIFILSIWGCIGIVKADNQVNYTKSFISVEIESGDTLTSIAREYAISETEYEQYIEEVRNINSLKDDTIHAGCFLLIPYYEIEE